MTEVPEHLLARAKAARQRMTGEGGGDDAPAPAADAPVAAAAAAPTPAAAAPAPVVEAPPEPDKPWVEHAKKRQKIPYWVAPVLLFLPIWMFIYIGTLEAPPQEVEGPLAIGADIYSVSCASCHGSAGGGGVGPALSGGEVLLTFPDFESQVAWVVAGSPAAGVPFGDPNRPGGGRVAQGGMPGFGGSLTADELLAVVLYERVEHGGQAEDELAALETLAQTEGLDLTTAVSGDDVRALLAELGLESGELAAE